MTIPAGAAKQNLSDFAALGGTPAFSNPLHVGRPNVGDRDKLLARIGEVIDRRWLTNDGPYVRELEAAVQREIGVRHCVATCNGTIALELAIRALGLAGEVIVPSFTFVATAHALQWQEITPVFCDVDPSTHTLDPSRVEALIGPSTTGIIGVHLWGEAHHVEALEALASRHRLKLLFDAAHAFACSYGGTMIGNFGNAEILSFHATKFLNTFEGGAICTNDDELAARCRLMRNFGFAGYDNVVYIGTNGKMSEVAAAMGLTGLEALDAIVAANAANYHAYSEALACIPGVTLHRYDETRRHNYQYVVAEIDDTVAGLSRDVLVDLLHAENVIARRYFHPGCHRMEPYRSLYQSAHDRLPVTEALCRSVLVLPTGTAVSTNDIAVVGALIRSAVAHGPALAEALARRRGKPAA